MIHIVYGPPCAGKSTFVEAESADGDLIVDFDKIAVALGSGSSHDAPDPIKQVAFRARSAAITAALRGDVESAWIIHTRPRADDIAKYREVEAKFHLVDPGQGVCLERSKERPDWTGAAIEAWYASPPVIEAATADEKAERPRPEGGHMKIKEVPVNFKAGPEDGLAEGEFLVYPSTFTREPDSYGDVVAKGAFLDDIKQWLESGNTLPGLYGHRLDDPDFFVAGAQDMGEDDHGWWVKGAFDLDSPKGPQVYRLVKSKRLNQLSFAYDTLSEGEVELGDGRKANELRKLKVYEFSFVPVGANQDTSVVAVKAATDALMAEVKVGKPISAANEKAIDSIADQMLAGGQQLKDVLAAARGEANSDEGKASGHTDANSKASDEEPAGANSPASDEEPRVSPSARVLAAHHSLILEGIAS